MVGEPSIGMNGRRVATDCVDHPHTLASGRRLTNTLMRLATGRRNRIARRGVVVIEVAMVLVLLVGCGRLIARCGIVVIEVTNVLVVFVGFHVRILGPVVGVLGPRAKAGDNKGGRGSNRQ